MTTVTLRSLATALLTLLLATVPAQAAQDSHLRGLRTDRAAAERALTKVQRLQRGEGVRTGRELTPALADLARRSAALAPPDRSTAEAVLARPPSGQVACNASFCVHWVSSGNDAPPPADANGNGRPDYIEFTLATFEQVRATENGALLWRLPPSDGAAGGDGRTDVYVEDVGEGGAYGSSTPEPASASSRTSPAYLTVDDDYAAVEFPSYGGNFEAPLQVTAAHEYNHVLQFGYDLLQDPWMFEATATWMEDKVFTAVDDYHLYLDPWAQMSTTPITLFAPPGDKVYGSAIWNHWIDGRRGAGTIRRAWEVSSSTGSFAPGAYDLAIREAGGPGFAQELIEFSVATAEWDAPNSGIHEGATFPRDMVRAGSLAATGRAGPISLDHTGYVLLDIPATTAAALELTGSLPAGTLGGVALVGFDGNMTSAIATLPTGGQGTVALANPGRFSRITAVGVNADTSHGSFDGNDWTWTRDGQPLTLTTVEKTAAPPPPPPPRRPPPVAATVKLHSGGLPRLRRLARQGVLAITVRVNVPGRLRANATVDMATAKRLRLGRDARRVGAGSLTLKQRGRATVRIRLTKNARAGLQRQRRAVRILVRTTFTPARGGRVVRKNLPLLLRP